MKSMQSNLGQCFPLIRVKSAELNRFNVIHTIHHRRAMKLEFEIYYRCKNTFMVNNNIIYLF